MKDKILKLKKWHSIVSSLLFIASLFICSYLVNKDLSEISLSHFGINKETSTIWNTSLFIVGILLWIDSIRNIYHFFNSFPNILVFSFTTSIIFLLLTASIDMNSYIHNIFAVFYFFGYTISMFIFGKMLLKSDFRIGITSIWISILCFIVPSISFLMSDALAYPEIVHTMFVLIWVIFLSWEIEYKNFLKKIGF
jgi:cytochrome bd-type quinol oxidase subunit 2